MIEFRPLASSSAGCAYLVKGSTLPPLLIDCGLSMSAIRRHVMPSSLGGCLISHGHGDHCKAVPDLLKSAVNCYASVETWQRLGGKHHRAHMLVEEEQASVAGWEVLPFEAVHDEPGTLGFLIAGDGAKLLYLTDSAYSKYRFDGLTHIAIECNWSEECLRRSHQRGEVHTQRMRRTASTHMSLDRAIAMLKANDLSRVQEIHLLHLSDQNSDEEVFRTEVQRATGKIVKVAPR